MTNEQIITVANSYVNLLQSKGIEVKQSDNPLERAAWCASQIPDMIRDGKFEKANRWLGFVQGVLFVSNIFDIEEMKSHNKDTTKKVVTVDEMELNKRYRMLGGTTEYVLHDTNIYPIAVANGQRLEPSEYSLFEEV